MEKGASSPFAQAKRADFQVLRKGAARPFSIGRISPPRAPRKKSEECKKQFLLGELLFLGGSNSSHSARLLPAYFVFPSRTQKAADENRSSQKPPAARICARTFGNQSNEAKCSAAEFAKRSAFAVFYSSSFAFAS
jgi:hypothetical protein